MNEEYINRINKTLIYIDENLENDLSLVLISSIAFYSPFHLHRLFKAITNETLNAYITRKRIEKAASLLINRKELTVSELAMQYGFNSNSSFTRAFKKYYGQSPTAFRKSIPDKYSKISKVESKNRQEKYMIEEYFCNMNELINQTKMNAKIEIKEIQKIDLAFITQLGVNGLDSAFERLIKWAKPKGLTESDEFKLVRIYHDSFKITEPGKVRMSACIILKDPVKVGGEIGLTTIGKGKCIVGHFVIEPKDFEKAWSGLFIWMNENAYKKADRNPFEIFHNNYHDHPEKKCIVDLYIPIE
ncbi:MAG: AraC family transcriptional regulator [Bacteroidales bacterium]|nr:AraC family transcriptional regulator [Bacteroidales bacterium]